MNQVDRLVCAPKYLLGKLIPKSDVTQAGIVLPNAQKYPTNVWKCLKIGAGLDAFPDIKPGDMVIPQKQTPVTCDRVPLSMVHESWIFAIIPEGTVGTQLERIVMAPGHILAKLLVTKGSDLVQMPTTATSFWEVVKVGRDLVQFPTLAPGDSIAPEKHAAIQLDNGAQYGVFREDWIVATMPKMVDPSAPTEPAPAEA